jgi:hypothetical protein
MTRVRPTRLPMNCTMRRKKLFVCSFTSASYPQWDSTNWLSSFAIILVGFLYLSEQ